MKDVLKTFECELTDAKEWFYAEIASLRTGRATPALVEDLLVDSYGAKTPLKHIASISTPDARSLVIQPWDKGALEAIGKAIENSSLNFAPIADGDHIRLTLPQLTEERRKDLLKILNGKAEEVRMKTRRARDETWKEIQQSQKDKVISEDEKFRVKDELQKKMDGFNTELESTREKKEREIMEV
ncbi:MAG: ribosome recycling factor [Candidatus Ryanbacteria bacterium RIFCSPLOWO2_02_FULL_45_11c]|uniref:Ribosome-recycling factor n=1 Tax=Candidatus Ryanbacteria bacterium RIFCSPLOWO2_02_FULL_45_11c TaxID=1802128 RepID=A0A1G2GU81_9BACT|nr:MAG: ribosome recycling factor [Candidatus Ryanbacteria bacterium RIFCSPLOWO2_02_FULL_45_11c]